MRVVIGFHLVLQRRPYRFAFLSGADAQTVSVLAGTPHVLHDEVYDLPVGRHPRVHHVVRTALLVAAAVQSYQRLVHDKWVTVVELEFHTLSTAVLSVFLTNNSVLIYFYP